MFSLPSTLMVVSREIGKPDRWTGSKGPLVVLGPVGLAVRPNADLRRFEPAAMRDLFSVSLPSLSRSMGLDDVPCV